MEKAHLCLCLVLVAMFISCSEAWWLPCSTPKRCGSYVDSGFRQIKSAAVSALRSWVQSAILILTYSALGTFNVFAPKLGKRSTLMKGNLEQSLLLFHMAEQADEDQNNCLSRVICEAAYLGRRNESTIFQTAVSAIAVNIAKRKPKEIAKVKKMTGGHIATSMLLGNEISDISKCKTVSKTCKDKYSKQMHHQMEKVVGVYESDKSEDEELNTILDSEELSTSAVSSRD